MRPAQRIAIALLLCACRQEPSSAPPSSSEPFCGDGARSNDEPCEGDDLAGADCLRAGFEGGALSCNSTCTFDTSGCTGTGPVCGDGKAEGLEQCDGAALGNATCASLGQRGGTLACNSSCQIDTGACLRDVPYDGGNLATAIGCEGVFNPDQVLIYHLQLPSQDWTALLADTSASVYFRADFRCADGLAISVGVRRKRSGGLQKPGLKIDFNRFVPDQTFFDLRKLSLEVGASAGGSEESERRDIIAEHLANRLMFLSGAIASRTSLAQLYVNGDLVGTYTNVEDIDKRFLRDRINDDSGWLYKKSGGDDGLRTNETMPDPYAAYFCFWQNNGCEAPSAAELAMTLSAKLDIDQLLRLGAVNALIGNTDSPIFKDNNYFYYDYAGGPRAYFAWDLDTVMRDSYDVFRGGGGGGGARDFAAVLFSNWDDDYDRILTDLIAGPITLAVIEAELDRILRVAEPAFDADPFAAGDSARDAALALRAWWRARIADVAAQVAAH